MKIEAETVALIDQIATTDIGVFPNLDQAAIAAIYIANRSAFRMLVKQIKTISKGTGGILSTGDQMFWSSVLFTRLAVMAQSVLELAPAPQPKTHWDFSALASLVRNLAECYLVLYFLCFDDISEDERQARFLMMHMYDNFSRCRLLSELGLFESQKEAFEKNREDLERRIRRTAFFSALPEKRQSVILKADRMPFVQDDVLEEAGFDRTLFRGLYRLLSSHTHTGPVAFYRMRDFGNGTGVENLHDKAYMSFALGLAIQIAEKACANIIRIFPNAKERGIRIPDTKVSKHIGSVIEAQMRGEKIEP